MFSQPMTSRLSVRPFSFAYRGVTLITCTGCVQLAHRGPTLSEPMTLLHCGNQLCGSSELDTILAALSCPRNSSSMCGIALPDTDISNATCQFRYLGRVQGHCLCNDAAPALLKCLLHDCIVGARRP